MILTKFISCYANFEALDDIYKDLNDVSLKLREIAKNETRPTTLEVEAVVKNLNDVYVGVKRRFGKKYWLFTE